MSFEALDNWKKTANSVFRVLSIGMVSQAEKLIFAIQRMKSREFILARTEFVERSRWNEFYSERRRLFIHAFETVFRDSLGFHPKIVFGSSKLKNFLSSGLFEFFSMEEEKRRELVGEIEPIIRLLERDITHDLWLENVTNELDNEENDAAIESYFRNEEAWFLLEVFFPCLIQYGALPAQLLASATDYRTPNFRDLERLLLLDDMVIHHPRVVWLIHNSKPEWMEAARDAVKKSLGKSPTVKGTAKRIKCSITAWIQQFAKFTGEYVSIPEIRQLFNLKAKKNGKLIDRDLQPGNEAYKKMCEAIRNEIALFSREKSLTKKLPTDQKAA